MGWRNGWWREGYLLDPIAYDSLAANDYVIWPPNYHAQPAGSPDVAVAPLTTVTMAAGKMGRLVYDTAGKPVGVILQYSDGSQELVPLI